jgi:hypothetical protein
MSSADPLRERESPPRLSTRTVWAVVVAVLPVALSLLLLRWWLDASLFDYVPVLSDDASYWHQATSFARVGFDHGYYTYQEVPPAIGVGGPWGPAIAAFVGSVIRLTGLAGKLAAVSVVMIATFVILAATGLVVARKGVPALLGAGILLTTFGPLILYLGSGMQEPIHLGLAVLLAALFHRQIDQPDRRISVVTVAVILVASLLRPLWALLLLPALLLRWHDTLRQRVLASVVGLSATASIFILYGAWSARFPGPWSWSIAGSPLEDAVGIVRENLARNLGSLFRVTGVIYRSAIWQRYFILMVAVGLTVLVFRNRFRGVDRKTALVAWVAIVPAFGMVMLTSDITPHIRVLAPGLLFLSMLALFRGGRWVVIPLMVVGLNMATWSAFQHDYELLIGHNYAEGDGSISQMRETLAPHLQHEPGADPWCNTVLLSTESAFFFEMAAIDPGIGVSIDLNHEFETDRIRSKYVIATDYAQFLTAESFVKIVDAPPRGVLYLNLESDCPEP